MLRLQVSAVSGTAFQATSWHVTTPERKLLAGVQPRHEFVWIRAHQPAVAKQALAIWEVVSPSPTLL
eukprot:4479996-Amphidinium_carterae.1